MRTTIVLSTLLSLCLSARDNSVCTPPTQPGSGPEKPTLPDQYQIHVECNILNRKQTTTITENYDNINNRGEITQVSSGTVAKGYFDYDANEYLSVLPGTSTCTVQDLSSSASNFIFGYQPANQGAGRIFSPSGALHFTATGSPEVYVKKDTIRGIPVDTWYSCQYWPNMDATMNVTWYFSDKNNWDSDLGTQSVPVAAHVTGNIHNGPNFRSFEHWYHFYRFTPSVQDKDFEIPDGIVCPYRKNMKPVPDTSISFMMTGEVLGAELTLRFLERGLSGMVFSKDSKVYTFVDLFNACSFYEKYDRNQKIAGYTYKPSSQLGTDFGVNRMDEINDFNTGVAYIIDRLLGNCTVTQIDHGNFLYRYKTGSSHKVRMLTPKEFFLMDDMVDSYTYIGKRTMRGILCDTWTGIYRDTSTFGYNVTVEWYFLSGDWTTWNDISPMFPGSGVPVAMVNYNPNAQGQQNIPTYQFNVFNFDRSIPNVMDYDISPCYVNDNRRMFHVSIDGQFEGFVSDNMEIFRYSFLSTVVGLCNISPLRVANIKVDLDEDIHVTFEMLDVTPVVGDNILPQVSLSDAANLFINSVQTGTFKIFWNAIIVGINQAPNITVQSDSLREMDYETRQFGYTGAIGFGPGSMAGVAFAMVIIGGTMGAGTSFFCFN